MNEMRRLWFLVFIVFHLTAASAFHGGSSLGKWHPHQTPSSRIAGGRVADPHSAPYVVFIRLTTFQNTTKRCGGTVLTSTFVLTAKHCIENRLKAEIFFGAHDIDVYESSQVRMTVSNSAFITHDYADLGLIRLPRPVDTSSRYISVVKLPRKAEMWKDYTNKTGTLYGWGALHTYPEHVSPNLLHTVNVRILPKTTCGAANLICTSGFGGRGACPGDSGGPLLVDEVQIGMPFLVSEDCEDGSHTVYYLLNVYLDWLEKTSGRIIN